MSDLVGRDAELARLRRLIAAGDGPRGLRSADEPPFDRQWLVFTGPPGVGKTTLLDAAAAEARERGRPTLQSAGTAATAGTGYAALRGLLLPVADRFGQLRPPMDVMLPAILGLRDGPLPRKRRGVVLAVMELLKILARPQATEGGGPPPGVLVLDDLEWVDQESAAVLVDVMRATSSSSALLVGACRPGRAGFFDPLPSAIVELAPVSRPSPGRPRCP